MHLFVELNSREIPTTHLPKTPKNTRPFATGRRGWGLPSIHSWISGPQVRDSHVCCFQPYICELNHHLIMFFSLVPWIVRSIMNQHLLIFAAASILWKPWKTIIFPQCPLFFYSSTIFSSLKWPGPWSRTRAARTPRASRWRWANVLPVGIDLWYITYIPSDKLT